ncbi:solute carrier family 13 member 2-like isoform X2 [Macrobrachium rosenbergii]|uniref:solute carrier family 13 member 2-like isoform X2 n=1 Tax=Macrobrachium rosenbergii TaxID=79674 RepID=UPI0034D64F08
MPSLRTIIKMYWKTFLLVLSPIIVAVLPIISDTSEARCGYVMIVMAIFWMTEIFPLAITSLIPVFAFPFLGIIPTGDITRVYMKENIMMFIGGVTIAVAVEHCNLHKRIALFVIFHLGQSPRRLMAGFMLTTMFLSMWISNTATTAMMVRVVDALLVELFISSEEIDESIGSNGMGHMELQGIDNGNYIPDDDCESGRNKSGQTNAKCQKVKEDKPRPKTIAEMTLNDECRALKDMCFLAVAYSANVGGTGSMTGTGSNLVLKGILESAIKDASSVILIIFALFALPADLSFFKNIRSKDGALLPPAPGCLNWKVAQERVPWGLVFVMGGGLALAEGCKKSGLSSWMGEQLVVFNALPKEATVFLVCLLIAMLTEVTSNTATASIFLPVLKEMAVNVNVNPLYLMLPATICCSYAFMLPVATPPNAIVYGAADMKSSDMMKAGIVMNVLCVFVITGMVNTLGVLMFDLHTLPAWAEPSVVSQHG